MIHDKDPLRDVDVPVDGLMEAGMCFVNCVEWIAIEGEPVKKNQPIARFVEIPGKRFRGGDILILAPESGYLLEQIQKTGEVVKFSGGIHSIGTIRSNTHLIASEWHIPYEQPAYCVLYQHLNRDISISTIIWLIGLVVFLAWEFACILAVIQVYSNWGGILGTLVLIVALILGLLGLGVFLIFGAALGQSCTPDQLIGDKQHHKESYINGSKIFYSNW